MTCIYNSIVLCHRRHNEPDFDHVLLTGLFLDSYLYSALSCRCLLEGHLESGGLKNTRLSLSRLYR
jgi:hypothetical protein